MPIAVDLSHYPKLRQYVGQDVPPAQKLMAARGLVPLVPLETATVLFLLTHDSNEEVRDTAAAAIRDLPPNIIQTVVESPEADPLLLHYLVTNDLLSTENVRKVILNNAIDDKTLAWIAKHGEDSRALEQISTNQIRMERYPKIAVNLVDNKHLSIAYKDRASHFVGSLFEEEPEEKPDEKAKKEVSGEEDESNLFDEVEVDEEGEELSDAELFTETDTMVEADIDPNSFWGEADREFDEYVSFLDEELVTDSDGDPKKKDSLFKMVQEMPVSEKIKLALKGNKEARNILLKESNKLVSTSVMRNPRLTDGEVVAISQSRNINEDCLRLIAQNREWVKNYQVKLGLVCNPKTPVTHSMKFLNMLNKKDILLLSKNKNVPAAIQAAARRKAATLMR